MSSTWLRLAFLETLPKIFSIPTLNSKFFSFKSANRRASLYFASIALVLLLATTAVVADSVENGHAESEFPCDVPPSLPIQDKDMDAEKEILTCTAPNPAKHHHRRMRPSVVEDEEAAESQDEADIRLRGILGVVFSSSDDEKKNIITKPQRIRRQQGLLHHGRRPLSAASDTDDGQQNILREDDILYDSQPKGKTITLRGPPAGRVRLANEIHAMRANGASNEDIFYRLYKSRTANQIGRFSTTAYDPVPSAMGMNGGMISLVVSVGGQDVQLFLSSLQDTVVGTNDLFSTGYTPGDSSTASLANVCSSTPCVATFNASSTDLFGPYGFSGPVYQDRVTVGYTDGTDVNVSTGRFVAASSKSGTTWPFGNANAAIPPLTANVGQFGVPVNTTACYGSTCFTGVYGNILNTYSLDNIVSVCSNYSVGSIVTLGGTESTLYTGSITYANIASSSSFNVSVVSGYEDAIVVTAITVDGDDMTGGSGQSAIGDYSIVEADSPYLLFQPDVYNTILATLINAIDSTKSATASTPDLESIFYAEILANITTDAQYYALPPINMTVNLDGSTSANILIPVQAYLPTFQSWEFPVETRSYVPLFNSTVNIQSVTGNNTILGLPFFYSYYTVLDRANERIGFATPSNACSIGCASLTSQTTCNAESNCAWCFNPLNNEGVCVESTAYGAAAPTANSIYICPPVATTTGGNAAAFASPLSFWTVAICAVTSIYLFLMQ